MNLLAMINHMGLTPAFPQSEAGVIGAELGEFLKKTVYPRSVVALDGVVFCLVREEFNKNLVLIYKEILGFSISESFSGTRQRQQFDGEEVFVKICPLIPENADGIRKYFQFTRPRLLGIQQSLGCGDRIGLATPGHIQAVRETAVMPILAQQSISEMTRTRRTPKNVLDDALWAVFQEGYRGGFGADADHLKTETDIEKTFKAGFTLFTFDAGDFVDTRADTDDTRTLEYKFPLLRWRDLDCSHEDCLSGYIGRVMIDADFQLEITRETLMRAAVKFGNAIARVAQLFRFLKSIAGNQLYEVEISVDETAAPTSAVEHFFIASELKRLQVHWVSLAPRFTGTFEKGIDFKGNVAEFEQQFIQHLKISQYLGPYKISLHSGSDKFSIYPIVAKHAGDLIHVKTGGTSYLEALHTLAQAETALFREILDFAIEHFATDMAAYPVSANLNEVPDSSQLSDAGVASLLQNSAVRQLLHVTFGSVLSAQNADGEFRFRNRILHSLIKHEELHYQLLKEHFGRHLSALNAGVGFENRG